MAQPVRLAKGDARKLLVNHHFAPCASQLDAFHRLRSIQFDPIAPVGCNQDLVLQARVPGYRVGDWEKLAYEDRKVYDGWDKQASLVPFEGWQVRRLFHKRHRPRFEPIFEEYASAVEATLKELETRGPLMPSELETKERREDWKGTWHGPNLSKRILRALWHTGQAMTTGRRKGQHVYDLTARVVPSKFLEAPELSDEDARRELFLERHRAIGFLRPTASYEVWSYFYAPERASGIQELLARGQIVPVEVEGVKAHATPEFLEGLDTAAPEKRVVFVAPLDQLLWDRNLVQHVFEFDYIWEIYVPEAKRKWGYYVLPVLFGDALVARAEFWRRKGVLELKSWLFEPGFADPAFYPALEMALRSFMAYCSADTIEVASCVDPKVKAVAKAAAKI